MADRPRSAGALRLAPPRRGARGDAREGASRHRRPGALRVPALARRLVRRLGLRGRSNRVRRGAGRPVRPGDRLPHADQRTVDDRFLLRAARHLAARTRLRKRVGDRYRSAGGGCALGDAPRPGRGARYPDRARRGVAPVRDRGSDPRRRPRRAGDAGRPLDGSDRRRVPARHPRRGVAHRSRHRPAAAGSHRRGGRAPRCPGRQLLPGPHAARAGPLWRRHSAADRQPLGDRAGACRPPRGGPIRAARHGERDQRRGQRAAAQLLASCRGGRTA